MKLVRKSSEATAWDPQHDGVEGAYEWLRIALRAAKMGAWAWDLNRRDKFIRRTEQYDRIFEIAPHQKWTRDLWIGRLYSEDQEITSQKMESVITGDKEEYDAEYRIVLPAGGLRWVNAWGRSIRDRAGKPVRVTGVVRDISDEKRLEQDREQFVATLSHDLRNPLSVARSSADLIRRYPDDVVRRDRLFKKIDFSIERADRMIQDLLDSSRLQSGRNLQLPMENSDLSDIVRAVVQEQAELYDGRIIYKVDGSCVGTWSKDGIRRLLENLISNAIKYGKVGGPVTVTLDRGAGEVLLSVHNTGNLISDEEQSMLFQPFYRAKFAEQGSARGWGLGLPLVRGIAEAHGGGAAVQSSLEAGTTFVVRLPIHKS